MHEREYLRMKRQIEADYRKKLDALELVWGMAGGSASSSPSTSSDELRRGDLREAIRSAVRDLTGEFRPEDVLDAIRADDELLAALIKPASLSSALKRLAEKGEIELIEAGSGKRPSRYRGKQGVTVLKAVGE